MHHQQEGSLKKAKESSHHGNNSKTKSSGSQKPDPQSFIDLGRTEFRLTCKQNEPHETLEKLQTYNRKMSGVNASLVEEPIKQE